MTISADGLFAKHAAPFEDDIFGGVLGNTALAKDSMGMSYFEVKIEEAVTGMPDGLAIGVTSVEPSTLKRVPEILDGLGKAWLVGFDGIMYDAHDFSEVDWYPSELRIGDRVGCLVTVEGQLQIFVNGKWRLDGPKNVDTRSAPLPGLGLDRKHRGGFAAAAGEMSFGHPCQCQPETGTRLPSSILGAPVAVGGRMDGGAHGEGRSARYYPGCRTIGLHRCRFTLL